MFEIVVLKMSSAYKGNFLFTKLGFCKQKKITGVPPSPLLHPTRVMAVNAELGAATEGNKRKRLWMARRIFEEAL